jgi:hypothetical protein
VTGRNRELGKNLQRASQCVLFTDIIRAIQTRTLKLVKHVSLTADVRNAYTIFSRKSERKRLNKN